MEEKRPRPDAPPENIPLQGTHRGSVDDPLTSSVRAQQPAEPTAPAEHVEDEPGDEEAPEEAAEESSASGAPGTGDLRTYQLARDPDARRYRVRVLSEESPPDAPDSSFEEVGRRDSADAFPEALRADLPDGPRFVVLENTETGEVHFDRANRLADWQAGGGFDQMTLFESEDEAARYAEERQHS